MIVLVVFAAFLGLSSPFSDINPPDIGLAKILSVQNAGLLFTDNPAGVDGTDAGYSVPLGKQTLWLFGDVFLRDPKAPEKPIVGVLSNCGLLVPKGTGAGPLKSYRFLTYPSGLACQLIDSDTVKGKDLRFWPFGGWYDASAKKIYLFYGRIRTTGNGPFAFKAEGHGLTVADATHLDSIRFRPLQPEIWWPNEPGKPVFGSAVTEFGGFLYVYGFQERGHQKFGKVARVPKSRVRDLSAFEYYAAGDRWCMEIDKAADIDGLSGFPTELSVTYNAYLGGYLAVHSIGISDKVRLSLALSPWGPFRPLGEISTPTRALSKGFCYAGKEHPELAEERGRIIYVTYVDSSRYWLQLLKVTLRRD